MMPKCVVFSERAFVSILVETHEKIKTETGGVFLGYRKDDVWYVIESIDPGPNSIFRPAYFEYDQNYINHLINKVSRIYATQLDLIGLWHRHPGSYDSFSGTDDGTNTQFAELNEAGAISALVNIDPQFRLTVYSVTLPLKYEPIKYVVGDSYIPKELLALKNSELLLEQLTVPTQQMAPSKRQGEDIFAQVAYKFSDKRAKRECVRCHDEFSFHEALYKFLNQRTYGNVNNSPVKLTEDTVDNAVLLILEKLEDDLQFLSQLGVECEMTMTPDGSLKLYEKVPYVDKNPGFEANFGSTSEEVIFSFNECRYKYYPGLFRDAYLEFLTKEGSVN